MMWEEVLRVTIPGQPIPKGRPRFAVRGRGVKTYTDPKTKAFEKLVARCVGSSPQLRGMRRPICGNAPTPARVDIVAVFQRPVSMMRRKDAPGLVPMGRRPDIDNGAKSVLDWIGLANNLIWDDDGQVCCLRADAYYAEKGQGPRTEIVIYREAR